MNEYVRFLSVEDGDDLVVAFALGEDGEGCLTLIRTPKYEDLLLEEDRGVYVGHGTSDDLQNEFLMSVHWGENLVRIESTKQVYSLNIGAVDPMEIQYAKSVLGKMNFDHTLEIRGV